MAEKTDAYNVSKKLKHDEPDKKIPIKHYDDYIKDADPDSRDPRGGQERRT